MRPSRARSASPASAGGRLSPARPQHALQAGCSDQGSRGPTVTVYATLHSLRFKDSPPVRLAALPISFADWIR